MTETLGPDEKLCPFCAEVIRAAAIKCRYCQSDLPVEAEPPPVELSKGLAAVGTAHDIRETVTEPNPAEDSSAPPPGPPPYPFGEPAAERPVLTRLATILLAACVLLAGGIAALWLTAGPDDLRTAHNGQVTSVSYRDAAMSAAAANASTLLSYGYKTLDADQKAASAVVTPAFARDYAKVMKTAGPKAKSEKLTLKATVEATSVVSLKKDTAKVLLFINTLTTRDGSAKQQLNQNRVLVTMTRSNGDWVVSKMDPF